MIGSLQHSRKTPRARLLPGLCLLLVTALLASCATGPRKRIFPPTASIQEIQVLADGRWLVQVRMQNYSTVAMRFERITGELEVSGRSAGRFDSPIGDSVPAGTAEALQLELSPPEPAVNAMAAALANRSSLSYRINGTLTSSEPRKREDSFEFESALTPMPGLEGVLR